MSGVNQITIVGNVGSPPELSYGQNNNPFCRFSVAVNEQWKTDGEKREKVTLVCSHRVQRYFGGLRQLPGTAADWLRSKAACRPASMTTRKGPSTR